MPTIPDQVFTHMLNPLKGWPSPYALDKTAKYSSNVGYDMVAGQVCHLNSSGELEPGAYRWQMPLFIFQGVNELDVNNAPTTSSGPWWPVTPTGRIMCLVAKGPFEFWTTEFDTDQTYAINDPLRAPTGNSSGSEGTSGVLTNQGVIAISDTIASGSNKYTNICGIVSGAVYTNNYGVSVLPFWPVYYPGHPSEAA